LALRHRVWDGLSALERSERQLTARRPAKLADVRAALDTMGFATSWGGAELEQLRLAFPGSALLDRYAARLDERAGRPERALAGVDPLRWAGAGVALPHALRA